MSTLFTPHYFPKMGRKASPTDFPHSVLSLRNNYEVPETNLREVFKANLARLMQSSPDLNSGPKLEARSGVGKSSIARWLEDPPSSAPTLDSIASIAGAFGVQPWELLVDERTSAQALVDRLFRRG